MERPHGDDEKAREEEAEAVERGEKEDMGSMAEEVERAQEREDERSEG